VLGKVSDGKDYQVLFLMLFFWVVTKFLAKLLGLSLPAGVSHFRDPYLTPVITA
jgi:hypothetical protein